MNRFHLSLSQLRRAADIKERIDALNREFTGIFDGSGNPGSANACKSQSAAKKRTMSVAARKRIAAAQRARWAKIKRAKKAAAGSVAAKSSRS